MGYFGFSQLTVSQIILIKHKLRRGNFELLDLEKSSLLLTGRINAREYTNIDSNGEKMMLATRTAFVSINTATKPHNVSVLLLEIPNQPL